MGRIPKAPPSPDEREKVLTLRRSGWGWESIAHEISQDRAAKVSTAEARANKAVSHTWLRKHFSNETDSPTKRIPVQSLANLQRNRKPTAYMGPRITLEEIGDENLHGPLSKADDGQSNVEVASGGSKA